MKLSIVSREENPVLQREKIELLVEDVKATPSRKDIREKLAAQLNVKDELVIVGNVGQEFGKHVVKVIARVYKNKEGLEENEAKHIIAKNFPKEKGEGKAGAVKEEKAEEIKGEKKEGVKEKEAEHKKEKHSGKEGAKGEKK